MKQEEKKPTQYDYDKLFLAYEEARSDITTHFRKILELQKENEQLKAKLEKAKKALEFVIDHSMPTTYNNEKAKQTLKEIEEME